MSYYERAQKVSTAAQREEMQTLYADYKKEREAIENMWKERQKATENSRSLIKIALAASISIVILILIIILAVL